LASGFNPLLIQKKKRDRISMNSIFPAFQPEVIYSGLKEMVQQFSTLSN